ncbi:hypothetical protein INR49_012037 [Caranx melampygus]|nr:hypothetical protein INR49_012037 [Caranx melampygus]
MSSFSALFKFSSLLPVCMLFVAVIIPPAHAGSEMIKCMKCGTKPVIAPLKVMKSQSHMNEWLVHGLAVSLAASSITDMVKASPGTQVSETPPQLRQSLSFLLFQSPDAADDMQFIDDGSSNPALIFKAETLLCDHFFCPICPDVCSPFTPALLCWHRDSYCLKHMANCKPPGRGSHLTACHLSLEEMALYSNKRKLRQGRRSWKPPCPLWGVSWLVAQQSLNGKKELVWLARIATYRHSLFHIIFAWEKLIYFNKR